MSRFSAELVLLGLCVGVVIADQNKFLIITSPALAKIVYTVIPDSGEPSDPEVLIDSGLKLPQGICVDHKRSKLLVADPDLRKILAYTLSSSGTTLLTQGEPSIAAQDVEVRWVSIDGRGSVFFTDEANGRIMKVSGEQLRKGNPTPVVIYDSSATTHVSAPGGIAVDNFHVYWSNKASGTQNGVGSVVRGFETPRGAASSSILAIASNTEKVYGVCLSENNVFYTDTEKAVYGVKKKGSAIAVVSDKFQEPRGCVWDGDGTVFVADKKAGTVYSFAGNMEKLAPTAISTVV